MLRITLRPTLSSIQNVQTDSEIHLSPYSKHSDWIYDPP